MHGEQYLEILDDIENIGTLETKGKVIELLDKKSGALAVANCKLIIHLKKILQPTLMLFLL